MGCVGSLKLNWPNQCLTHQPSHLLWTQTMSVTKESHGTLLSNPPSPELSLRRGWRNHHSNCNSSCVREDMLWTI